jgi:hypothetical protein
MRVDVSSVTKPDERERVLVAALERLTVVDFRHPKFNLFQESLR